MKSVANNSNGMGMRAVPFARKKSFAGMAHDEILLSASEKIFRSVSASEQSTARLASKLEACGYPSDIAEEAIAHAVEIGAIDDRRYCESLIRSTLSAGKGLELVQREIESLGVDIFSLEAYQDYLDSDEDSLIGNAVEFLSRHTPRAKNLRGACYRKLRARGFSSSIASRATGMFCDSLDANQG